MIDGSTGGMLSPAIRRFSTSSCPPPFQQHPEWERRFPHHPWSCPATGTLCCRSQLCPAAAVPLCAVAPLCPLDQARSNPALPVLSQLLGHLSWGGHLHAPTWHWASPELPGSVLQPSSAPCPCPTALTSRQWIHLPDAPNYSGWRWPLAHLSLNQALPSVLSRAVQLTACAWHGINFFFYLPGDDLQGCAPLGHILL